MKNKAQLGTGILNFPVLIILVVLMAAFIFISMGATFIVQPAESHQSTIKSEQYKNLLLEPIKVKLIEDTEKEILLIDAIVLERKGLLAKEEIDKAIESLREENTCLVLMIGSNSPHSTYPVEDGQVYSLPVIGSYEKKIFETEIKFTNSENKIVEYSLFYYYGPCEVKNE